MTLEKVWQSSIVESGMNPKLAIVVAAIFLTLAAAFWFCFRILSSMPPEQLLAAQLYRPVVEGNPLSLRLPTWAVDLHWQMAGEQMVDSRNRSGSTVVLFMLGTEMRQTDSAYPVDQNRFKGLMQKYVCETSSKIPSSAEIVRYRSLETIPVYIGALKSCGKD